MSEGTPSWNIADKRDDDPCRLDFESIDGTAKLYIEKAELVEFDRTAFEVILEDSVSGNRRPVGIDFNRAEAENHLDDFMQMNTTEEVKEMILKLRGENQ